MWKGIDIWKRKVYDDNGVCKITQICLKNINLMYLNDRHVREIICGIYNLCLITLI